MPPEYLIPAMAPGATYTRERKMLLPIALTYLGIAHVDYGNDVIETDETNNIDSLIFSVSPPPRPDLEIDTISFVPADPTTRDSITFSVRVRNNGPGISSPCYLQLKIGGESMPPEYLVPAMASGATYTRERKMLLPIALTYLGIAYIDSRGEIAETSETNNRDSIIFSVDPPPRPDLEISSFTKSPASPTTRDSITFSVQVRNNGPGISSSCYLRLKIGGESMPPEYLIPAMAPGATYTRERKMLLPIALTYLGIAHIDYGNDILESDETNNIDSLIFTVDPPPLPDLFTETISYLPDEPDTNDEVTFTMRIRNGGADDSKECHLRIKVDDVGTRDDVLIPGITAGEYYDYDYKRVFPVASQYKLTAIIDAGGMIEESNEGNNETTKDFEIINGTGGEIDYVVENLDISPPSGTPQTEFTLTVDIVNRGDNCSIASKTAVTIGYDNPVTFDVPGLSKDEVYKIEHKFYIDIINNMVMVQADSEGVIPETNEENNVVIDYVDISMK
jgi:subtilase family serine protease